MTRYTFLASLLPLVSWMSLRFYFAHESYSAIHKLKGHTYSRLKNRDVSKCLVFFLGITMKLMMILARGDSKLWFPPFRIGSRAQNSAVQIGSRLK